ncbi:MAG: hypothetical protein IT428_09045 [Planctomycetaceae bacterium]|nr:hypothetical protein [Planctomycetaceae bacterium]
MTDPIFRDWLQQQHDQGMDLASQSEVLKLEPVQEERALYDGVPQAYIAKFFCQGVVIQPDGAIVPANEFHAGIWFPSDYLRTIRPYELVTWLGPTNVWHPNIRVPIVCVGRVCPGYELVELLYELYEIITFQNYATHDYLNDAAAEWARNHKHLLPTDRRPLKRRATVSNAAS